MIKKLFLCSGVHGSRDALGWLARAVAERRPDALLFAGGILSSCRPPAGTRTVWSLTLPEAEFIEGFFTTLGGLKVFSAVIPGPAGEPLEEFLRLGLRAELAHPTVHLAHAMLVETDDLAVFGLGGTIAEEELLGVETCSRSKAEYFLRSLSRSDKPRKALLLPSPPPGPLGGLEGDPLIGDLIDSYHPDLCVVAGGGGRRGCEHVGKTLVVNPGPLSDGSAAWLDWGKGRVDCVDFLDLRPAGVPRKAPPTEEIRRCAYQRWLAAGRPENASRRFWAEAERDLLASK